jgi:beta-galactosidase
MSRPPTLEDGIFFSGHVEGRPGVQPQRLGPYCSTLNPGYDSSLPLYQTWPLFDAIHDASAESPELARWSKLHVSAKPQAAMTVGSGPSVGVIAGSGGVLAAQLQNIGLPALSRDSGSIPQLLFVDGTNPPDAGSSTLIDRVLTSGGTVFVWGADPGTLEALNVLLPTRLEATHRAASSLVPVMPSAITTGLEPSGLYFSDQRPSDITDLGLAGPLIDQSRALLAACNTDWLKWNNQPEYAKTAMVIRSEREAKPSGVVLAEMAVGRGLLLLTTLSSTPSSVKAERIDRTILANLGVALKAGMDSGKPLLRTGDLVRALACGFFSIPSVPPATEPWRGNNFRAGSAMAGMDWRLVFQESGVFDVTKLNLPGLAQKTEVYLSFWLQSPRSLQDLLLEPNLPQVDLHLSQPGTVRVWLNDQQILDKRGADSMATASALRLRAGWNHFLIKLTRTNDQWAFAASVAANQPDFLSQLDSSLEMQ